MQNSKRNEITAYIKEKYGAEPEYLWARTPDCAVFRHSDNRKWFGLIMNVPYSKLDPRKDGSVDILNVKIKDMLMSDMLTQQDGFYRAYHMNHQYWLSIALDGSAPEDVIRNLIDMSFDATASSKKKQEMRPPKEWLIPSNPKYFDIISSFEEADEIDWKQGKGIKTGDTVYLYVGAPISAVLYKCLVTKTDIPYDFRSDSLTIKKLMRIKLLRKYPQDCFTFERLKTEFGIFAVRGPRGIPDTLSKALE